MGRFLFTCMALLAAAMWYTNQNQSAGYAVETDRGQLTIDADQTEPTGASIVDINDAPSMTGAARGVGADQEVVDTFTANPEEPTPLGHDATEDHGTDCNFTNDDGSTYVAECPDWLIKAMADVHQTPNQETLP